MHIYGMVKHIQVIGKNMIYKDKEYKDYIIRTFDESIDLINLMWHRDKCDRIIKAINNTDWLIQLDNEYPKSFNEETFIPKETYHRLIKGTKSCKIKIINIETSK